MNTHALASPQGFPPGIPACTKADLEQISLYDIQTFSWSKVNRMLSRIDNSRCPLDLTNGKDISWWVWLARWGKRNLREDSTGIHAVWAIFDKGAQRLIVDAAEDGQFQVSGKGKLKRITRSQYESKIRG